MLASDRLGIDASGIVQIRSTKELTCPQSFAKQEFNRFGVPSFEFASRKSNSPFFVKFTTYGITDGFFA